MLDLHVEPNIVCWHAITHRRFLSKHNSDDVLELQALADVAVGTLKTTPSEALTNEFLTSLAHHPATVRLVEQTRQTIEPLLLEWNRNFSRCHKFLVDITGLTLDKITPVYLTHPSQLQGLYCSDLERILWSYRLDWSNYNTVYLWHLILHAYLPVNDLTQVVLELITDEMRVRLNGGSYPPFLGHPSTMAAKFALIVPWRDYLLGSHRDIHDFLPVARRMTRSLLKGPASSN